MCKKREQRIFKDKKLIKIKIKFSNNITCLRNHLKIRSLHNFRIFSNYPNYNKNKKFMNNGLILYLLKDKNRILKFKKIFTSKSIEKNRSKSISIFNANKLKASPNLEYLKSKIVKLKPFDQITVNLAKIFDVKKITNPARLKNKFKNLSRQ
ncbi:hypothetical protein BNATCHR189 (nucleomorph) [Bigelowiella natans]|uniref:Uncharacterized protein n=1 Tax=Bigelowiella natans TaxID=227086 RepID=Q3LWK3_BIGNA|nr:hypothetical protein BNATCHR189 [Bigelowiella natans]ABA27163.1 hypothetical protein [Bigelowiella natans]